MKILDIKRFSYFLALAFTCVLIISACDKDDPDEGEDPNKIELFSFGPSPALRGGNLNFIGKNLDQVTEIVLPNNVSISNFTSKTADKIVLVIPEETVDGKVVLKNPQGDITTKSNLTISEPIAIVSFTPAEAKPGQTVSITGTYLNLIEEVIFHNNVSVLGADFVSKSQEKLEVVVPEAAQTGPITISNGMEEPILVSSETDLIVTLPTLTALNPSPVKAGSNLTVTGTNLDLVKEIGFTGGSKMSTFVSQSGTEIVVQVPEDAQDGPIKASVASLVEVTSSGNVTLSVPSISNLSDNPIKPGANLVISGSDMDLTTTVVFGGGFEGTVVNQSETSIEVTVPLTAIEDVITLNTKSGKSVSSSNMLGLFQPTISSILPMEVKANEAITVLGDYLDLVSSVNFVGGTSAAPTVVSENELSITIPTGTLSGVITLISTNGTEISSTESLTIIASEVPIITGYPTTAKPGEMITLTGEKLDLQMDIIFPGNALATQFGIKTAEMLQVKVPLETALGIGKITFITSVGESTTSPDINFQGVDPVDDPDLVFFDFDGTGAKDSWWGNVQIVNDGNSVNGTSYGKIEGNYSGWSDLFWRNSNNNFPGATIGTNVDDYVIKFDIYVLDAITAGNLKMRLNTSEGDYWWLFGPASSTGETIEATNGWVTVVVPISDFHDDFGWGANSPSNLSDVPNEFGMAFDNGDAYVNFYIDNVRFELK